MTYDMDALCVLDSVRQDTGCVNIALENDKIYIIYLYKPILSGDKCRRDTWQL